MLDQHQGAGHEASDRNISDARYHRLMPGGGYVEIDVQAVVDGESTRSRGRLIVERRSDHGRRIGHAPPIIAEIMRADADALIAELFHLANDNAALARHLMRWQAGRAD